MYEFIGRKREITILRNCLKSKEAEFIAVYGRRRVGKTFLVKTLVKSLQTHKNIFLEVSGIKNGTLKEQLANFMDAMANTFHKSLISQSPRSWKEAFLLLNQEIARLPKNQMVVIFLDELPWLSSPKSKLICEIKFNDTDFVLNKQYAMEILERNQLFSRQLKINKQIFTCFITKEKMKDNLWAQEIVDQHVVLEDLFSQSMR